MGNLKEMRKSVKLTQMQVADILGIKHQTISAWEKGKAKPNNKIIAKLADIYHCSVEEIMTGTPPKPKIEYVHTDRSKQFMRIPVLGRIPAGIPFEAIADIEDYEDIPLADTVPGSNYFGLRIKGDSMEPEYRNNDIIILRQQNTCENGEDCAVMINGDDATFKRVKMSDKGITLLPLNSKYDPIFFTREEAVTLPVRIIGVVLEIRRKVRR